MDKADWKRKLSSRKFWVALSGFVTAILIALNVDNMKIEQVISVISAASVLVAYILAEGYVDGKREENQLKAGDIK